MELQNKVLWKNYKKRGKYLSGKDLSSYFQSKQINQELCYQFRYSIHRMKNSTLQNLINKYSNHSVDQNSVMFSKVSKVSRVTIPDSQLLKPTHDFYQLHESLARSNYENKGSLQKMKADCEDYLYQIREQLINQRMLFSQKQNTIVSLLKQKLCLQQKKLREYVGQVLDEIFREQNAYIQQQMSLRNHKKSNEMEEIAVEFEDLQKEVETAMRGLKSQNFRNAISSVALKDFQKEMKRIQQNMEKYEKKIVEKQSIYEFDRHKSSQIREHLNKLCFIRKQRVKKAPSQENIPIEIDEPENQGVCNIFS